MRIRSKYDYVVLGVIVFAIVACSFWWSSQGYKNRKFHAHVRGQNVNQMILLRNWLDDAFLFNPRAFTQFVGVGITTKATLLPPEILREFPSSTPEMLTDSFGKPFNIMLSPKPSDASTGRIIYSAYFWSDGPNGLDESRKGDDISSGEMLIENPEMDTKIRSKNGSVQTNGIFD
jgi:hypothetical protein